MGRGAGAGREWEAGVSQRLGTRVGEKQSQQFPREEAAFPPPPGAPSWELAHPGPAGPLLAGVPRSSRSSEGSLARPCLPAFLPTDLALAPASPAAFLPQHHLRSRASGTAGSSQGALRCCSWALAGPRRQRGWTGSRQAGCFTCSGGAGRACRASGSSRRGWERVRRGKGVALTPLPRQALPPKTGLFTARRGDTIASREKGFL